jgi:hypothetical protein
MDIEDRIRDAVREDQRPEPSLAFNGRVMGGLPVRGGRIRRMLPAFPRIVPAATFALVAAIALAAIGLPLALSGPAAGPGAATPTKSAAVTVIATSTSTATATQPTARATVAAAVVAGSFTQTGSLITADSGTATLLLDGRVLVVGSTATSPELYDPKTGKFTKTGAMTADRGGEGVALLGDGRVLLAGGYGSGTSTTPLASAEIYDPHTGKFSATGSMGTPRAYSTATLLTDGRVLIAGGDSGQPLSLSSNVMAMAYHPGGGGRNEVPKTMTGPAMLASAELYDPKTGKFSPTGSMTIGRSEHTAVRLADGRVLMVGAGNEGNAPASAAETYDPKTGKFRQTGSMPVAGYAFNATLLTDGRVFVSAGNDGNGPVYSLELYDPKTGKFSSAGTVDGNRGYYASTLLADGRVLLAGGVDIPPLVVDPKTGIGARTGSKDSYLATCEIYDPATGKLGPTGSMATSRAGNTATLLADGRVLVTGGTGVAGDPGALTSAELYQP